MKFKRHYLVLGLVTGIVLSLKTPPAFAMGLGFGGAMGGFGGIIMILFWGLVLAGIVMLVKAFLNEAGRNQDPRRTSPKALETLRERYAAGEIEKIEFEQKKQDLKAV